MDASYKIQRGIHVHLIQFFMCPEFWVHISKNVLCFLFYGDAQAPSIFCAFFCPEVDFAGSFGTWERPVTVETVEIKHRLYLFIQELKLPIDRNNISIYEKLYLV